jgi:hypothetical protein
MKWRKVALNLDDFSVLTMGSPALFVIREMMKQAYKSEGMLPSQLRETNPSDMLELSHKLRESLTMWAAIFG